MKSQQLSHHIFQHHVQEYQKASKTLLHHQATALFHEADQLSLELHKHHMFTERMSQNIYWIIKNFNLTHSNKLLNKSSHHLAESKWKHTGCPAMVSNLTDFQFSTTKMEAFCLGLKFATYIHQNITTNFILCNSRNFDTDFSKGFIQGIIPAFVP